MQEASMRRPWRLLHRLHTSTLRRPHPRDVFSLETLVRSLQLRELPYRLLRFKQDTCCCKNMPVSQRALARVILRLQWSASR